MKWNELEIPSVPRRFLEKLLNRPQKIPQTYLFSGPSHSGKEFAAFQFFKALNCREESGGFCGRCPSCRSIDHLTSPDISLLYSEVSTEKIHHYADFFLKNPNHSSGESLLRQELYRLFLFFRQNWNANPPIDKLEAVFEKSLTPSSLQHLESFLEAAEKMKRNIPLEHIGETLEKVYFTPHELRYRLLLIKDGGDLSQEGASALLKTIEEPPAGLIIILIARRFSWVLPTLRSRSIHLRFPPYSKARKEKISDKLGGIDLSPFLDFRKPQLQDLEKMNRRELAALLDKAKRNLSFFSPLEQEKIHYLNQLKSGLKYYNLSPSLVQNSLKIILEREGEG